MKKESRFCRILIQNEEKLMKGEKKMMVKQMT